jgi:hypothetical protein
MPTHLRPRPTHHTHTQEGTNLPAVGPHEERGAVPGLLQATVVVVEGRDFGLVVERGLVLIGLGHKHHQSLHRSLPRADGERHRLIQVGRVRHLSVGEPVELLEVGILDERLGLVDDALARSHPVDIAEEGVDLAIVTQAAEGLGQGPARHCVGAEATVVDGKIRLVVRVLQVLIILVEHY